MNGNKFKAARKYGYRSGLELKVSQYLDNKKIVFKYEAIKIEWEDLAYRTYTPDFILPNNIIIEVKGRFITQDRRKHREIKRQHPHLDIRFVFENSKRKLYKGAKTTYKEWCERYGFLYYDRIIPESWLKEKKQPKLKKFIAFREKRTN
tara:strand:- start:197 stop:643 length:447 start_codon:yes stop_codon:yes gene_type:complete